MEDILQKLLEAGTTSNWRLFIILALVAVVSLLRFLGSKLPGALGQFVASDRGGAVLALVSGIGGSIITAAAAGASIGLATILNGVIAGFTAAGGWTVVRKILGISSDPAPAA